MGKAMRALADALAKPDLPTVLEPHTDRRAPTACLPRREAEESFARLFALLIVVGCLAVAALLIGIAALFL